MALTLAGGGVYRWFGCLLLDCFLSRYVARFSCSLQSLKDRSQDALLSIKGLEARQLELATATKLVYPKVQVYTKLVRTLQTNLVG
jgi:hypothetical protein